MNKEEDSKCEAFLILMLSDEMPESEANGRNLERRKKLWQRELTDTQNWLD